jgi:hypothetical protein
VFIPGIPLLNVRLICDAEADDAQPMESSVAVGVKITSLIATLVREHNLDRDRTTIYV